MKKITCPECGSIYVKDRSVYYFCPGCNNIWSKKAQQRLEQKEDEGEPGVWSGGFCENH
jgi:uncharacterized Zn ribbon protein